MLKNFFKFHNNSGLSLLNLLTSLTLLAVFITVSTVVFKNFYTTKTTISRAQQSLDVSGSIIYDVFDSMGYLAENLGRGNCQNLNFEDILTDLYKCSCSDNKCYKATCLKTDPKQRSFFTPLLGIDESNYSEISFSGKALYDKFSSVYDIKPQTHAQLKANGMPENVIKRCENPILLSSLKKGTTEEDFQAMMAEAERKALSYEYFTLIIDLLKDEIRISNLYSTLLNSLNDNETYSSILNTLKGFHYPKRTKADPNPVDQIQTQEQIESISNFLISCDNVLETNKRADQDFTCEKYTLSNSNNISTDNYSTLVEALNNLKDTPMYQTQKITIDTLINLFTITDPNTNEDTPNVIVDSTENNYQEKTAEEIQAELEQEQKKYEQEQENQEEATEEVETLVSSYRDKLQRLSQILNLNYRLDQSLIDAYTQTYNEGNNPLINTNQNNLVEDLTKNSLCNAKSIYACFNIQDNGSESTFLLGTNPLVIEKKNNVNTKINCYSDTEATNPLCTTRSSVILEVKVYPMSVDDPENPNEMSVPFARYNDSGSLNRLLKMIYILHWTKKIDGSYKYFRTSGSFTMATSSNLRQ